MDDVRAVKRAAGVTVNDVVLAVTAGAVRRFLLRSSGGVERLLFRAMVPVSTHPSGGSVLDNEVSVLLAPLPLAEPSPRRRLDAIARAMSAAKASGEVEAVTFLETVADASSFGLVTLAVRALVRMRPYNVIVTNVPGPGFPLYLLGAQLERAYPMVPLYGNNALGIALLSYDGHLYWGLSGDPASVPRLKELEDDIGAAFHELEREFPAS
jgi:WS/DGAT/MGAT family acyltransferase